MGDFITVRFGTLVQDKRILGVDIVVSGDTNTLTFNFGDSEYISTSTNTILVHALRNMVRRIQSIEHSGAI